MTSRLIYIFLILTYGSILWSQPMNEADLNNMLEIAEERVLNHDYLNGLLWYEKCYDLNKSWEIGQNIGHMNMHLRDYGQAAEYYRQAIEWDKSIENPELRYLWAKALKMNGQSEEAINAFEFFLSINRNPVLAKSANLELDGIRASLNQAIDPTIRVTPLGEKINSRFSESSPFFVDGHSIVYSAFDPEKIDDYKNKKSDFKAHIYLADLDETDIVPVRLGDISDKKNWHQSNLTFSADRQLRAITYAHLSGLQVDRTKIFIQEKTTLGWSEPIEITALGEKMIARHINFANWNDKLTIFFAAELIRGRGKMDIYYAEYYGQGKISNPVNLIGPINSEGDEITPFFFNNAIYFSSNGHTSMGGLDVFVSYWDGLVWSTPYNLGSSINSHSDDFYYVTNADQSLALFVSNRPEGNSFRSKTCCDDIYMVTYIDDSHSEQTNEAVSTVRDRSIIDTNQPILLPSIYFDLNSDHVNMASQSDLDILYDLLVENPDWIVELGSHTDSRGHEQANLDLSSRRAENARKYLLERGIAADRIQSKGYGEEFILNHCTNGVSCSEKEHRYNHRTEFSIVEIRENSEPKTKPKREKYPKVKFDHSFYDFGTLKKGEKKTHIFNFQNIGEADLVIELASACECTTLDYPTDPIQPGGRGQIVATYDSKDKMGEQEVTIDILANTNPIIVEARFRVFVVE